MNATISELAARIKRLEDEIEAEIKRRRVQLRVEFENQKIKFDQEILEAHRRLKAGLIGYIFNASPLVALTTPIIFLGIVPLVLFDLFLAVYQITCFPIYGIPHVRRRDYFVFDRGHLAYLNVIEKVNCAYCSYANGFASYAKEVIARTELYWCPIKHARQVLNAHVHYNKFADFGDAEAYKQELESMRRQLAELGAKSETRPVLRED